MMTIYFQTEKAKSFGIIVFLISVIVLAIFVNIHYWNYDTAALLAVLIAFFQGSNTLPISPLWFAVLVFSIYFVLIQIKAIWLRPRVMKHFLHMNEGLIFVAIIGAAIVWGILGALIIVPLMATGRVVGRYVRCRLLYLDPWSQETNDSVDNPVKPHVEISTNDLALIHHKEHISAGKNRPDEELSAHIEPALVWSRHEPL